MKVVYKYELKPSKPTARISLPEGAKALTAATQSDGIFLWVEVDTSKPEVERYFEVFGTGHEMPTGMGIDRVYINTVFLDWMVFHVYERL